MMLEWDCIIQTCFSIEKKTRRKFYFYLFIKSHPNLILVIGCKMMPIPLHENLLLGRNYCSYSFLNWQLYKLILGLSFVLFCRWNEKIIKSRQCNICFIAEVNLVMSAETSRSLHNVLDVVWDFNLKFSILSRPQVSQWGQTDTVTRKQLTFLSWYHLVHTWKKLRSKRMCGIGSIISLTVQYLNVQVSLSLGVIS